MSEAANNILALPNKEGAVVTKDILVNYLGAFGFASSLTKPEQQQFISIAQAYNLNPFKREIYCTPYETSVKNPDGTWGKKRQLSIVTGYEVYLKRAERLGFLDGWKVEIKGEGNNMIGVITIYRKDWTHAFEHEVYFSEVSKKDKDGHLMSMWKTMPKFMLKKVAVAQGFRLCFPDEMGGMPYTSDELPDNMTTGHEDILVRGTTSTVEVISEKAEVSKIEGENSVEASKPEERKYSSSIIGEGEVIPKEYWNKTAEEKASMIPAGCGVKKIEGVFICVRK